MSSKYLYMVELYQPTEPVQWDGARTNHDDCEREERKMEASFSSKIDDFSFDNISTDKFQNVSPGHLFS